MEKAPEHLRKFNWYLPHQAWISAIYGTNSHDPEGSTAKFANLRYANLYGADLSGADLYGADLRGVSWFYEIDFYASPVCSGFSLKKKQARA